MAKEINVYSINSGRLRTGVGLRAVVWKPLIQTIVHINIKIANLRKCKKTANSNKNNINYKKKYIKMFKDYKNYFYFIARKKLYFCS